MPQIVEINGAANGHGPAKNGGAVSRKTDRQYRCAN